MRTPSRTMLLSALAILGLLAGLIVPLHAEAGYVLPQAVQVELLRLGETYHVLDVAAAKVWPGWSNYKEFPFLLRFENGLRVLVGHPNPPQGFELLPEVKVAGKDVCVDRRNLEPVELVQPLTCGGGINNYGTTKDGKDVPAIQMELRRYSAGDKTKPEEFRAEQTILIYIHELFHCFQIKDDRIRVEDPNFNYNPDTHFAVYSELEGSALEKAYAAADPAQAKACLADFLAAREIKRKDIPAFDRHCESGDEVREGTAVYSEVRTLEVLSRGFKPGLTPAQDRFYGGFKEASGMLPDYTKRLDATKKRTFGYLKCYEYGCFQALMLERLFPGWQEAFKDKAAYLDEILAADLGRPKVDPAAAEKRFAAEYGLAEVTARQGAAIKERDDAYALVTGRKGRSYIISLKLVHQFVSGLLGEDVKKFELGLMQMVPGGTPRLAFDDVEVSPIGVPVEINQLYYIKVVDTESASRAKAFEISAEKFEGGVYKNAVLTTPLFTLTAPAIRVSDDGNRVRIWVLSRVKGASN